MGQPSTYIKISAIQCLDPAETILTKIKTKFEKRHPVQTEWSKEKEENAVFIYFSSQEAFYTAYKRDIPNYELFLQILLDHPEFTKEPLLESPKIKPEDEESRTYCILKYETNDKIPLRNYYRFIFQVGQMLGVQHSFEEIENGFLLFYRRSFDFELSLLDLLNINSVIAFLKKNNVWTAKSETFICQLLDLFKQNISFNSRLY
jgi:hypothetical protein